MAIGVIILFRGSPPNAELKPRSEFVSPIRKNHRRKVNGRLPSDRKGSVFVKSVSRARVRKRDMAVLQSFFYRRCPWSPPTRAPPSDRPHCARALELADPLSVTDPRPNGFQYVVPYLMLRCEIRG